VTAFDFMVVGFYILLGVVVVGFSAVIGYGLVAGLLGRAVKRKQGDSQAAYTGKRFKY